MIKVADIFNETTIKGVYAAGDIVFMQSLAVAVSQGSIAAAGTNHALIKD